MKIKKIKHIKVNGLKFKVIWNKNSHGSSLSYGTHEISIGCKSKNKHEIFQGIVHELMEICAIETHVRLGRPDCSTDYVFVYDHRQHSTICDMFSGLISQFIK